MTCRCDALEARIAALESRLSPRQPSLFTLPELAEAPGQKYPSDFASIWTVTGRRGTKYAAFLAWKKVGRPSQAVVMAKWGDYLKSPNPVNMGAVMDLSTWLNKRGHAQEWPPAGIKPARQVGPSTGPKYESPTSPCFAHTENPQERTVRVTPGCSRCAEQQDELPPWAATGGGP